MRIDIPALYRPIDEHEVEQQARADAYRARVRDAALRLAVESRAELLSLPAEKSGYRIDLRGCIGTEIRRALEHGASTEQIRAALLAPITSTAGTPASSVVRLIRARAYAEWADHGPDRPAVVSLYTSRGHFAGLERTNFATDETSAQVITRLTARAGVRLSRYIWRENTHAEPGSAHAATGEPTTAEEEANPC